MNYIVFDHDGTLANQYGQFFDGIPELLKDLKKHSALGVWTGGSRAQIIPALDRSGLTKLFDFIHTQDDHLSKPSLAGLRSLGVKAGDILIGDSAVDIYSAKQIGALPIQVTYGTDTAEHWCENVCHSVSELRDLLMTMIKG